MSNSPHDTALSLAPPPVARPWSPAGLRPWRALDRRIGLTSRFFKGALLLVGATLACQLCSVALAPVLTRLYSPADFGVLGVFLAMLSPLFAVVCLKYENAIPLPCDERHALQLVIASAAVALGSAAIVSLLVLALARPIAGWFHMPLLANYLWVLPWVALFGGWYNTLSFWNLRAKRFGRIASSRAAETVGRIATECALGVVGWQPAGLLVAQGLAKTYGTLVLATRLPWRVLRDECRHGAAILAASRSYRNFPLLACPSALANTISASVPCLLLPLLYGPVEAGLFLIAQRLASWPITLFGQAISQVFYSELSSHDTSPAEKCRLFQRLSLIMATGATAVSAAFLSAPLWCGPLLGAEWYAAGAMIAALSPMLAGQLMVSPFSQSYYVYAKQQTLLALDLLRLVLNCAVFLVGWASAWPALTCIFAFSLSMCALYVLHWFIIASLLRNDAPAHPAAASALTPTINGLS